jgi:hypothetical protein
VIKKIINIQRIKELWQNKKKWEMSKTTL